MYVGVPAVPVSPAYSLVSQDLENLRHIAVQVEPGLVFAADGARFARALARGRLPGGGRRGPGPAQTVLSTCSPRHAPWSTPDAAHAAHRPRHRGEDPVHLRLDQPAQGRDQHPADAVLQPAGDRPGAGRSCARARRCWSTGCRGTTPSAATTTSTWCVYHGGSLYVDEGKPAPGLIERTCRQPARRPADPLLQRPARLRGAAALPRARRGPARALLLRASTSSSTPAPPCRPTSRPAWPRSPSRPARPGACSRPRRGARPRRRRSSPASTSPSTTQASSACPRPAASSSWSRREGKLGAAGARAQRHPWATTASPSSPPPAFDDEGYYRIGDAGRLADPTDPRKGVVFDGRVAEDFKLTSGIVGQRRRAAGRLHRRRRAGRAGRRDRRRGPLRRRRAGVPRPRRLPRDRPGCPCGQVRRGPADPRPPGRRAGDPQRRQPRQQRAASSPPRSSSPSRPRSTPARSPTRVISISARSSAAAPPRSLACTPARPTRPGSSRPERPRLRRRSRLPRAHLVPKDLSRGRILL